ncbi:hypothetical protein GS445_06515 [Rhodococcus hoagii]|uniref:Uncharacterized protein n=1 Tax=Rhodococcus hoagii TaxID=43767 RepID=A0A9Q2SAF6_RHOHA|nr:hypothetical protein [Prescottella equi]MBM4487422.1 hypothetical protein [Prescottella equi]MBM4497610.1 hypothetical protein [Prescottella equi]MBM4498262.1 hypothetical protein [Prescottella equi]MBM4509072.1 hypothetical protein [Prescottella equi]MBM4549343.1 hypothetical protein [Prescottella equi]
MSAAEQAIQDRIDHWTRVTQRRQGALADANVRLSEAQRWLQKAYDDMDALRNGRRDQ